ncbi:MAG: hypothetical protein HYY17_13055 [Planctomycetes bacterium]|nr:hypothetical protein [Planctomycetota bacterium]
MILLLAVLQADDLEARLQRRPTVSLELKDVSLRAAFEELSRRTGIAFETDPGIANDRVTAKLERAGAFEAAHAICRAHGGARLLFPTFARKVQVVPGAAAAMPASDTGPFHILLANVLLTRTHSFDRKPERRMSVTLWLAWTEDGSPASLAPQAVVTEAVDDTGRDLRIEPGPAARPTKLLGKPVLADPTTLRLDHPAPAARRIRVLKGYREAVFIAETRPVRIEGLETLPASSKGGELTVKQIGRSGRGFTALMEGPRPDGDFTLPDHHQGLCFLDAQGRRYPARVTTSTVGAQRVTFEVVVHDVPEEARIVAVESSLVSRWKSWKIPFEFADVELP